MKTLTVEVSYEEQSYEQEAPQQWVQSTMQAIWALLGSIDAEIGISFISDEAIQTLNRTYRYIDEPTDILSFATEGEDETGFWPGEEQNSYLGDIAISLDALKRNAQSFNVETEEELLRLLIHGTLHLLGHDHQTNDSDEPMLISQEALLAQLRGAQR